MIDELERPLSAFEVEAADDAEAIWIAKEFSVFQPVTLWQGVRLLGRFVRPAGESRRRCGNASLTEYTFWL